MAIKFEKVKPGMVLLDVHKARRRGEWGEWPVEIISVQEDGAIVSWNTNPPRFMRKRNVERLYAKSPKCIRDQRERRTRMYEVISQANQACAAKEQP